MAVVLKLWIYPMYVAAKCLHIVMSYMKQNKKRKQTLKSAHCSLEIIFKTHFNWSFLAVGFFPNGHLIRRVLSHRERKRGYDHGRVGKKARQGRYDRSIKCRDKGLFWKNINPHLVLKKKSFLKICLAFFAAASQSDLRKRFAVPNDKFLKYFFSFGARNACVILRRHVFVTSYVVATRILSHTVSVSAYSWK